MTPPYGRKWRRTKEPLDESEREEWKSWLKTQHLENEDHGIWSHHFLANRWGNSGNGGRLYFGGSKITVDGDYSHEMKRCLLLGRKVMTNLDSILKSRDITLPTKVCLGKTMVFPVVMYGCESWTVKKAERRRINAFELWCWRRLLRVSCAGGQCEEFHPWQRSWGRGFGIRKGGIEPQETPVPKHLPPKPESAYFTALCSHLHLWFYGGPSPTTPFGGVNLQLQWIKIPGRDKGVSGQTSLLAD